MLIRRPHETDAAVRDQIAFVKSLDICIIAFGSWNEALVATGPRKTSALIADQAPLQFPDDIVAWSTWPYCGEAETQRRAAKRLGVARATVANYLSNARKRGLLESKVVANILKDGKLSSAVCEKYGLQHDYVIPRTDRHYVKPDRLRQRAGEIGARFLKAMLREGDKPGVACGRSMLNVADPLPRGRVAGVTVTQIAGSMLNDERSSSEFRTAMIAFRLGAKSLNIHAPAVMSSKETRDRLMREPSLALYGERLELCEIMVFGVGPFDEAAKLGDTSLADEAIHAPHKKQDAAAILVGRFIDAKDREVTGPPTDRRIGMALDDFRRAPRRLLVAADQKKLDAIHATLASAHRTQLLIDHQTAQQLVTTQQRSKVCQRQSNTRSSQRDKLPSQESERLSASG